RSAHFDPLLLLLAALVLDLVVGELPGAVRFLPHPVQLVGHAVTWFDVHLNREKRGERARLVRGIFTVAALIAVAASVGLALAVVLRALSFGWAIEIM